MSYTAHHLVLTEPANRTPRLSRAMDTFNSTEWLPLHSFKGRLVLYHYTSYQGMKGIIESRSLWHSNVESLNDQDEIQYGFTIIRSVIEERIAQETDGDICYFLNSLLSLLEGHIQHVYDIFVACLSLDGNLLSQWRAYGDQGRGYSLGFEISDETRWVSHIGRLTNPRTVFLRRVLYDRAQQEGLVNSYISQLVDSLWPVIVVEKQLSQHERALRASTRASQALNTLAEIALTFKSDHFREEQEWRLIRVTADYHDIDNIITRERDGMEITYRDTFLFHNNLDSTSEFPLVSIMAGPALSSEPSQSDIKQLIRQLSEIESPILLNPQIQVTHAGFRIRA